MPTSQQIFQEEFEAIKRDLAAKHIELGMKASGQWESSLEVEAGAEFGRVIGEPYTEQLEEGRKPGKRSPIKAIEKWIIDKGIIAQIEGNIKITSLAFAIATVHAKIGWKRKDHGGVNLVSQVFTPKRVQSIIDKIGEAMTIELSRILGKHLKSIAV